MRSTAPRARSSPATATSPTPPSPSRPAACPCTRSRSWRAPTASPRRATCHDPPRCTTRRHRRPGAPTSAERARLPSATIIDLKARRRVGVGADRRRFVFENRDTVRFQIQEMARAEKLDHRRGHPDRARHLQPADPRAGRAVGDDVRGAHLGRRPPRVAARSSSASSGRAVLRAARRRAACARRPRPAARARSSPTTT